MKIRPGYLLLSSLLILLLLAGFLRSNPSAERSAFSMGTIVRIEVYGENASKLAEKGLEEVKRLNDLFDRFDPKSEISRINDQAGIAPVSVSEDTFKCVELAVKINRLSGRTFDITSGQPEILQLGKKTKKIFVEKRGARIDLGGIGKGYAADAARAILLKNGAKSGMIDMHSSIAVFGPKVWEIGIQHPRQADRLIGTVSLRDGQSLSTSGNYERGKHIVDPRCGKSAEGCQSVTVIGKSAAETDALSTAIFVLGAKEGIKLAETIPGIEVLVVDREGKMFKSPGSILNKQ